MSRSATSTTTMAFTWADDGVSHFDIETVALHEAGHGLSQGHFGKIHGTVANGKIHFSPRAVMNAAYSGVQRAPDGYGQRRTLRALGKLAAELIRRSVGPSGTEEGGGPIGAPPSSGLGPAGARVNEVRNPPPGGF